MSVAALRCRTSDRTRRRRARRRVAGARAGSASARLIGTPGEPRGRGSTTDLRDSHGCLLEAGGQVEDMLAAGHFPVLTASDCSICMTTFQAVVRHAPDVRVLWLDAHGDFNTPETTPSGFLGGMCLAAACGRWDAGFEPSLEPARVLMCGVRDLDAGRAGAGRDGRGRQRAPVGGRARRSAAPGLRPPGPRRARPERAARAVRRPARAERHRAADAARRRRPRLRVVGLEVTAFEAPEDPAERARRTDLVASIVRAVLP